MSLLAVSVGEATVQLDHLLPENHYQVVTSHPDVSTLDEGDWKIAYELCREGAVKILGAALTEKIFQHSPEVFITLELLAHQSFAATERRILEECQ